MWNTRRRCEICSKVNNKNTRTTPLAISHPVLVFLLLTLSSKCQLGNCVCFRNSQSNKWSRHLECFPILNEAWRFFSFFKNEHIWLLILLKNCNYTHSEIYWYLSGCCANNSYRFFISSCSFFSNFVRTHRGESSPITTTILVAQSCWFHLMTLTQEGEFLIFFSIFPVSSKHSSSTTYIFLITVYFNKHKNLLP